MNVGLYFGSFNPIHAGHLIIAQSALNFTLLDVVWMVISPQNPFKPKQNLISEYDRLRMVELATEGQDRILASNVEFSLPKPSYTIDTLTYLADRYRSYAFSLIMGEDNLQHLQKWKNYEAIVRHYPIYVYPRGNSDPALYAAWPTVKKIEAPLLDISATYLRELIRNHQSIRYHVPEKVYDYIEENRLYR